MPTISPRFSALALIAAPALLIGGSALAHDHAAGGGPVARAVLHDAQGKDAGTVTLTQGKDALSGTVSVTGLTPGAHGIHIHTTGKCDAPGFTTAGGHLNPDGKQHGLQNPLGAHQGDLPDVAVGADGKGKGSFTARTTVTALFDTDGAAFVVHAAPDDNKTDPSGNSGARLACGVFEKVSHK